MKTATAPGQCSVSHMRGTSLLYLRLRNASTQRLVVPVKPTPPAAGRHSQNVVHCRESDAPDGYSIASSSGEIASRLQGGGCHGPQ